MSLTQSHDQIIEKSISTQMLPEQTKKVYGLFWAIIELMQKALATQMSKEGG